MAATKDTGRARPGGKTGTASKSGERTPSSRRTATVNLPFVTAEFRMPEFRMPNVRVPEVRFPKAMDPRGLADRAGEAATSVRSKLPPPEQLAYYSGLGALAVLQVVEWPVALAIGAGTAIAQRGIQAGTQHQGRTGSSEPSPSKTPGPSTGSSETAATT